MPILPIDAGRYGTPEMRKIFEEETRLQKILEVEAALALAHAEIGNIPKQDAEVIARRANLKYVKLARVKEVEREIRHEVMAIVRALAESCGSSGAYVHLGATSNDILDTALALQLKDALNLIEDKLLTLESILLNLAERYKDVVMVGRTHGQHALPITLGFKFAIWMKEVARHIERLHQCRERVLVGKMSGAVGTQAGFGPHAMEIQRIVMEKLGLKPSDITAQVVQRDRYAELICLLALVAATLEKMATEIRELQRPEIGELAEPFDIVKQVGSSTMPHKRNPELCERICGLSRIVRSLVDPALQNIVTWHERDLTQSSAERFILPEALILVDYMIATMARILYGLEVNVKRIQKNLDVTQGRIMSEAVMLALTQKGMSRQEAHELVRKIAIESAMRGRSFRNCLLESSRVTRLLTAEELDQVLNPRNYLGTAIQQVEEAIAEVRRSPPFGLSRPLSLPQWCSTLKKQGSGRPE